MMVTSRRGDRRSRHKRVRYGDLGWDSQAKDTDLILNQSGERKVVEQVSEVSPDVRVAIFSQALVIEAVHLGDLPRFVVSTEDGDTVAVAQLEGDK